MIRKLTIKTIQSQAEVADWVRLNIASEYDLDGDNSFTIQIKINESGSKHKKDWHQINSDPVMVMAAKFVKQRDNFCCRKTGLLVIGRNCHCAHIFNRDISILRYDPNNLLTLSAMSHKWFDDGKNLWKDDDERAQFVIEQIGWFEFSQLRLKSQQKEKRKDAQFKWQMFYENQN